MIPWVAVRPVSGLDAPHHPTYQCQIGGCRWIGQNTKQIWEHCKDEYGWMNPRLAGQPYQHTKPSRHKSTPWIPVASQQFVHQGRGAQQFAITMANSIERPNEGPVVKGWQAAQKAMQ
jgi:hypothetical protein